MNLKQRITSDLTASMKERNVLRTSTLRMAKASMMNREIEKGGELTDEEMLRMLHSLVKQRHDSIEQYEKGGRRELADKEREEVAILEEYLPQAASPEEIEQAVVAAISEVKASSPGGAGRDMGRVMKAVQAKLAGRSVDNRMVSQVVKSKLG